MSPEPQQTVEIDGASLKAESEKSHEFRSLMYYGAQRERNREVTDVEQMRKSLVEKHNENLDIDRWLDAFRKLEELEMGTLIVGRHGAPDRFRWNYSLKAIGFAAVSGKPVTAYRIVPKKKGDKIVNDYNATRPTFIDAKVKNVNKENKAASTRTVEVSTVTPRPLANPLPVASHVGTVHHLYLALRSNFTFEYIVPKLTQKEADIICAAIKRCAS